MLSREQIQSEIPNQMSRDSLERYILEMLIDIRDLIYERNQLIMTMMSPSDPTPNPAGEDWAITQQPLLERVAQFYRDKQAEHTLHCQANLFQFDHNVILGEVPTTPSDPDHTKVTGKHVPRGLRATIQCKKQGCNWWAKEDFFPTPNIDTPLRDQS